jgi:predicted aminopeptidase
MRRIRRWFVVVVSSLATSACAVPFYWQAIGGQLQLLRKRVPIDTVVADEGRDPAVRALLGSVGEMRRFAVEKLDLPDSKSYRTYVDLGRPYVVWNVVATEEFSVEPVRSCFPFVGCVSYRGFFSQPAAQRFAARLARDGLNTCVVGATAYSTLGYFSDPVLSTMVEGGEEYLAEVLFHELAHQRVYIKNDASLSEAFATTVGEFATEQWLLRQNKARELDAYRQRLRYRADFAELVLAQQARLREIFSASEPAAAKRKAKEAAYEKMRSDYAALKQRWGGFSGYDAWFSRPLNNARLAAVATYEHWVPGLRRQLEEQGPKLFYAEVEALARESESGRRIVLQAWRDEAVNARRSAASGPETADGSLAGNPAPPPP